MTMLIKQHKRHQVQRQALLTKIVNLKLQQAPLLQKTLSHHLLISQGLLLINRKQQQCQKQSRIKKSSAKQAPSQSPSNQQGTQAKPNQSTYDPATDRKLQDKQAEHNRRYKGVLTMVDKDFSAAAGNWKGANGETITVSSAGQFTVESADGKKENYSIQSYSYTLMMGNTMLK